MATEGTSRGEFAQLVTHHVLCYIDRDKLVPVVDGDRLARDHVLMTLFFPPSFCAITRDSNLGSIYGPFFNERLITLLF